METAIVSLEIPGCKPVDVQLPVYVPSELLLDAIKTRLGSMLGNWPSEPILFISVMRPGETQASVLGPGQSLAEAGAWSGSRVQVKSGTEK